MDSNEFREFGKAMVNYIADYWDTIRDRDVVPSVVPGYLQTLVPPTAPVQPEDWEDVFKDIERVIMPGVTHWNSPNFHGYFPSGNSFPSVVGEMLSAGIGCLGFNWMVSPACTELEIITLNWLGKMFCLPEEFLNCSKGPGGGVIQGTASESTFIALLAAKEKIVNHYRIIEPNLLDTEIKGKLVAYTSDQANSSVEKAGLLGSVPMKHLPSNNCSLRGETLREAIIQDRKAGLIPFYVVATFGTTGTCAFDNVEELGEVCNEEGLWLHVDAAYAGTALVCPEFRYLMKGIHLCDSFNFNPHKWMLVNFDCSPMWAKDVRYIIDALSVDRIYLKHKYEETLNAPDFHHLQIPIGRRFRALKLWFVLRIYGVEGIQKYVRNHVVLAKYFASLVRSDDRFEVCTESLGLVCFRLKGKNYRTQHLLERLIDSKKLFAIPCLFQEKFVIRFSVCSRFTNTSDIDNSWGEILRQTTEIECCTKKPIETENINGNHIHHNVQEYHAIITEDL